MCDHCVGFAVLDARQRVDEPDHPIAVERADEDPAAACTVTARIGTGTTSS